MSNPLRTANLTGSISRNAGGLFESVRRLVQCLASSGMEVRVFGLHDAFTEQDVAMWDPVRVNTYQATWPEKFGYSPNFLKDLAEFAPDITHTHGIWLYPSVATNHHCRRTKTPYVISGHGMLDPWAIRNSRWKKAVACFLYENAHLKGAACLRALCEAEAKAIRHLGLKNPVAIIPNGIDLPPPGSNPGELPAVIRSYKASGRKTLLYLGRIHPKKGLSLLLEAWSMVRRRSRRGETWVLAIAGWDQGGHEAELKQKAVSLGIPIAAPNGADDSANSEAGASRDDVLMKADIVFVGPQFGDAKQAWYQHSDAFVLPSYSEGVPMVVLEAWAHGKPVLMTPECNLPCGFDKAAAIRIETRPEAIAEGLTALFGSSEHDLLAMGARGRTLVEQDYSWPVLAASMTKLYDWVLGGGAKPPSVIDF